MIDLRLGDCRTLLPTIPSGSVDCVITDPPYPEIARPYGRLTEVEWHGLMRTVVGECRRVLKPSGSAVFVLQPNGSKAGSIRPWLWEFMAWICRDWNMVQDAWWWRIDTMPTAGAPDKGLMRQSLKACVWAGSPDCLRNQDDVLWEESDTNRVNRLERRLKDRTEASPAKWRPNTTPIGQNRKRMADAAGRRGGVTPFNVLPISNGNSQTSAGAYGHGAGTPDLLADFWVRYISPPGGVVLDPFMGSGTIPLAAIRRNRSATGFEQMPEYFEMAQVRLDGPPTPLFDGIADLPVADETPLFSGATS
jgi:DNA modification methylase